MLGHGARILQVDILRSDLHIEQSGLDIGERPNVRIARDPFRNTIGAGRQPALRRARKVFRYNFHQSRVSPPRSGRTLPKGGKMADRKRPLIAVLIPP